MKSYFLSIPYLDSDKPLMYYLLLILMILIHQIDNTLLVLEWLILLAIFLLISTNRLYHALLVFNVTGQSHTILQSCTLIILYWGFNAFKY